MALITQDYYTADELAALKDVHPKSVYRWVKRGLAPAHEQLGGMYFFEKKAADVWKKPKLGRKRK